MIEPEPRRKRQPRSDLDPVLDEGPKAVSQARRGYQIASAEYREGLGSQLQVTDAELALRQSEYNYAQAVYEHLIARSNLDAALGTVPQTADEVSAGGR